MKIPYYEQETRYTCGPACCRMILGAFDIKKSEKQVAKILKVGPKHGTLHKNFQRIAEKFKLQFVKKENSSVEELRNVLKRGYKVVICYYLPSADVHHYAVVRRIDDGQIHFCDPIFGAEHNYKLEKFEKLWDVDSRYDKQKKWFCAFKKNKVLKQKLEV